MIIKSLQNVPGDTNAHAISATALMVRWAMLWGEDASGTIYIGDSTHQYGKVATGSPTVLPAQAGENAPGYDLSQIYYKLTGAGDKLNVLYALP